MAYQNPHFAKRLMELHVEEELHRVELNRLRRGARAARPGLLFRIQRLARSLRSLRWRREDSNQLETLFRPSQINRGA
ncbi:hypothetical protein ACFLWA_11085 [Chloroflexota bacterium]